MASGLLTLAFALFSAPVASQSNGLQKGVYTETIPGVSDPVSLMVTGLDTPRATLSPNTTQSTADGPARILFILRMPSSNPSGCAKFKVTWQTAASLEQPGFGTLPAASSGASTFARAAAEFVADVAEPATSSPPAISWQVCTLGLENNIQAGIVLLFEDESSSGNAGLITGLIYLGWKLSNPPSTGANIPDGVQGQAPGEPYKYDHDSSGFPRAQHKPEPIYDPYDHSQAYIAK
eukprot:gene3332-632_t